MNKKISKSKERQKKENNKLFYYTIYFTNKYLTCSKRSIKKKKKKKSGTERGRKKITYLDKVTNKYCVSEYLCVYLTLRECMYAST